MFNLNFKDKFIFASFNVCTVFILNLYFKFECMVQFCNICIVCDVCNVFNVCNSCNGCNGCKICYVFHVCSVCNVCYVCHVCYVCYICSVNNHWNPTPSIDKTKLHEVRNILGCRNDTNVPSGLKLHASEDGLAVQEYPKKAPEFMMKYEPNAYFDVGLLMPEVSHSILLNKVRSCFLIFPVTSYLLLSRSYFTETARVSFYGTHSIRIQNLYGLFPGFPGIPWNSLEYVTPLEPSTEPNGHSTTPK